MSSHCGSAVKNPTSTQEDTGSIPGLAQWVKVSSIVVSCDVGHRYGSSLALLWLWHRPAAAVLIRPLAWELSFASGSALKKERGKKIALSWKPENQELVK